MKIYVNNQFIYSIDDNKIDLSFYSVSLISQISNIDEISSFLKNKQILSVTKNDQNNLNINCL